MPSSERGRARARARASRLIGPSLVDTSSRLELPGRLPGLFNAHPYPAGAAARARARRGRARGPRRISCARASTSPRPATTTPPPPRPGSRPSPRRRRRSTCRARWWRRSGRACGARSSTSWSTRSPSPGLRTPSSTSACCATTSRRSPRSPRSRRSSRRCGPRPGAGPGDLIWTLDVTGDEDVEHITLLRRDGSRVIALWRPVSVWDARRAAASTRAACPWSSHVRRPARDVTVWRPSVSTTPVLQPLPGAPAAARPGRRPRARQLPLTGWHTV